MADVFDLRSHIVVAENQGELVGCVRVTSCPNDRDRFELDQSLAIPGSLIRKDTKEISQLSVSPKFENSDLAHRLIEKCVHICINLDAKHVVTSSVEGTLPLFRNLAFASVGALLVLDTKSASRVTGRSTLTRLFTLRANVYRPRERLLSLKVLVANISFRIRSFFRRRH